MILGFSISVSRKSLMPQTAAHLISARLKSGGHDSMPPLLHNVQSSGKPDTAQDFLPKELAEKTFATMRLVTWMPLRP